MVAPMLELMATLRVLVVAWGLPSSACEWDWGVLTVEAPICPPLCGRGSSLTDRPVGPAGLLLTVNSDGRTMTHFDSTVNSRHPCIFGLLPAGGAPDERVPSEHARSSPGRPAVHPVAGAATARGGTKRADGTPRAGTRHHGCERAGVGLAGRVDGSGGARPVPV